MVPDRPARSGVPSSSGSRRWAPALGAGNWTRPGPCPWSGAPRGPQLVNLDPSQPTATVTPFPVALWPGYAYPFPDSPSGYSIVRGEVLRGPAGAGVDQAQVTATAGSWSDAYLTDATGQWVFVLPDAQAGAVAITARDSGGKSATTTVTVTASATIAAPVLIPN